MSGQSRTTMWVIIAVVAALVVGGGITALLLTSGVSRSGDDKTTSAKPADERFAAERDRVRHAAEDAGVTLNSLDYRDADGDLDEWESVTTGDLHDEITNRRAESKESIEQAKTVTEAEVLSSAVAELNRDSGRATVLLVMLVHVRTADTEPTDKRTRIEMSLTRTKSGWQADGVGQVPYTP